MSDKAKDRNFDNFKIESLNSKKHHCDEGKQPLFSLFKSIVPEQRKIFSTWLVKASATI